MSHVMENSSQCADRQNGETVTCKFFEKAHGNEAQDAACQTIEQTEQAAKGKSIQEISQHGNAKGIAETVPIENNHEYEICQPEFHAGKGNRHGNQTFDVTENECQSSIYGKFGYFSNVSHEVPPFGHSQRVTASGTRVSPSSSFCTEGLWESLTMARTSRWGRHTMVSPACEIPCIPTQT